VSARSGVEVRGSLADGRPETVTRSAGDPGPGKRVPGRCPRGFRSTSGGRGRGIGQTTGNR